MWYQYVWTKPKIVPIHGGASWKMLNLSKKEPRRKWVMEREHYSGSITSYGWTFMQFCYATYAFWCEDAIVAELWDNYRGWQWEKFETLLPEDVIKLIASFELYPSIHDADQWSWVGSQNGNFSTQFALNLIRAHIHKERDPIWSAIWKAFIPQRIRFFLWLVGHDCIMSNKNRARRGLTVDPSCQNCPGIDETTLHILRDCPIARVIWEKLVPKHLHIKSFSLTLRSWLEFNLKPPCFIPENWTPYFANGVWFLWKWRNKRVFKDSNFTPSRPYELIKKHGKEIINVIAPVLNIAMKSKVKSI